MYYAKIQLPNLQIIQKKSFEIIEKAGIPLKTDHYYLDKDNGVDRFRDIFELSEELKALKFYDYWIMSAVIVCYKDGEIPIHTDDGSFIYSLLIPILNFENTYSVFYESKTKREVSVDKIENGLKYYGYDLNEVDEICRVESTSAILMNVKKIHSAILLSEKLPRITLSLRFNKDFNYKL